ncbi:hypothetical protein DPMN_164375 [Dreissena polymorpha]|nr:hypothetical protein DPMN_164375 [Dreissena polymorpha]
MLRFSRIQKRPFRNSLFAKARVYFGLNVNLKKMNIMGQDSSAVPCFKIGDYTSEVVDDFTYPEFTIIRNVSIDDDFVRASERLKLPWPD